MTALNAAAPAGSTKPITDARLVAAVIDRIIFNAHIIETGTESYRHRTSRTRRPRSGRDGRNARTLTHRRRDGCSADHTRPKVRAKRRDRSDAAPRDA